jgi:hypothetical protein
MSENCRALLSQGRELREVKTIAADGLLEQAHRHPRRRRNWIGMWLRVVSRNRAAKIVLDEMLDFGVRSCLLLLEREEAGGMSVPP